MVNGRPKNADWYLTDYPALSLTYPTKTIFKTYKIKELFSKKVHFLFQLKHCYAYYGLYATSNNFDSHTFYYAPLHSYTPTMFCEIQNSHSENISK